MACRPRTARIEVESPQLRIQDHWDSISGEGPFTVVAPNAGLFDNYALVVLADTSGRQYLLVEPYGRPGIAPSDSMVLLERGGVYRIRLRTPPAEVHLRNRDLTTGSLTLENRMVWDGSRFVQPYFESPDVVDMLVPRAMLVWAPESPE